PFRRPRPRRLLPRVRLGLAQRRVPFHGRDVRARGLAHGALARAARRIRDPWPTAPTAAPAVALRRPARPRDAVRGLARAARRGLRLVAAPGHVPRPARRAPVPRRAWLDGWLARTGLGGRGGGAAVVPARLP